MNTATPPQRTRRRGQHMTVEEKRKAKEAFLDALAETANVRQACQIAGIDHTTMYRWQEHDEEFSLKFKQANTDANWKLFGEAWNRATIGEVEYVVSAGKLVYGPDGKPLTINRKSDRLLELLLKARLPEFRDKSPVTINVTPKEYINLVEDGTEA